MKNCSNQRGVSASHRGQMMVLVALGLVVILGFAALATDMGLLWTQRRQVQAAADAAALAGDHEIFTGNGSDDNTTPIKDAAFADATQNGFTDTSISGGTATVTVNAPPASGPYAGNAHAVEVIVTKTEPTYFMRALGITSVPISARAVAQYNPSPDCVIALNPSANNALVVSGSGKLTASCDIAVDSTSTSGLVGSGSANITVNSPGTAINDVASSASQCSGPPSCDPKPSFAAAVTPDPFSSLTPPSLGGCTATNYKISGKGVTGSISAGTYCMGITVQGGASLTLGPGTYILDGGGLTVSGSTITDNGSGVTFFNTGTKSSFGTINVTGGSAATLSAPTSGTYNGILFYEVDDASITGGANTKNTISGGSTGAFTGAMYFPTTNLIFSGGASNPDCTEIVADTITISGASSVNNACAEFGGGSPIKTPTLAE